MNRRVVAQRMSDVTAPVTDGRGGGADLAGAVHQILATLTDVRRDTSPAELRDRIALVRWLRVELAAVDTRLTISYGQRGTTDTVPGGGRTG
jgi:hypothetical protein